MTRLVKSHSPPGKFNLALSTLYTEGSGQSRTQSMDFKGQYLVSISDADMLSSAYVDGNLVCSQGNDSQSATQQILALAHRSPYKDGRNDDREGSFRFDEYTQWAPLLSNNWLSNN